mmetsp:Transcript_68068/g.168183  ORF Transcript_68068/g.168183 Transcript_68068/m.168183 type:complete len:205 (+) Transcript_68068:26-640(+)
MAAAVKGIELPFPWALLILYPALIMGLLCLDTEAVSSALSGGMQRVGMTLGWGLSPVDVLSLVLAGGMLINFWTVMTAAREYQLEEQGGETQFLSKWDPSHGGLTIACLLSPLHVPLVVLRRQVMGAGGYDDNLALIVGVALGLFNLLLAHLFLQRDSVDSALFRGAYGVEVTFRDREMKRRRECEREVFTELFPEQYGKHRYK